MIEILFFLLLITCTTIMVGLDMIGTVHTINLYKKFCPKKDFYKLELNPMVKYFWKKFGLERGTVISILIQVGLFNFLVWSLWFFNIMFSIWFIGLLMGGQLVVMRIHLDNANFIISKYKNHTKVCVFKFRK